MITCDICENQTENFKRISEEYRDNDTKEVCISCHKILNVEIIKVNNENISNKKIKIKQFIKNMQRNLR